MKRKIVIMTVCLSSLLFGSHDTCAVDINIDTSSPFLYPEYSKRISMDFQGASLIDVLKIFSQQTAMNLITSENMADKKVTVYFDNVPVEQALEQILRANHLTYELQPDSDIYIVKPLVKPEVELITRVYHLKHAAVSSAKIRKTLTIKAGSGDGAAITSDDSESGILAALLGVITPAGKVVEDPRTNSLIVTDIANNFSQIELLIARVDIPVPQILIEVEMLEVSKKTTELLGIKTGDTPLTFSGGQRDHVYPWDQNRLLEKGYVFEKAEYRVGTINASGLSATLQLLRTQTDTKNLARPRILTLNNEPAQIKIATDEAIGVKEEASSADGLGTSTSEAERVETGVFLTVTPQANNLTGEITMAIVPRVIEARAGNTFEGKTFRDPEERGTQSILRVQSGDTIVIGGLLRDDMSKIVTKVPILGDIPLIGAAFRHKDTTVTVRELIIFITPHIINETPVPKTAVANSHLHPDAQAIIREQDIPNKRSKNIEKELAVFEKKKM